MNASPSLSSLSALWPLPGTENRASSPEVADLAFGSKELYAVFSDFSDNAAHWLMLCSADSTVETGSLDVS